MLLLKRQTFASEASDSDSISSWVEQMSLNLVLKASLFVFQLQKKNLEKFACCFVAINLRWHLTRFLQTRFLHLKVLAGCATAPARRRQNSSTELLVALTRFKQ